MLESGCQLPGSRHTNFAPEKHTIESVGLYPSGRRDLCTPFLLVSLEKVEYGVH